MNDMDIGPGVPSEIAALAAKPALSKLDSGPQLALVPVGPGRYELTSVKKFLDEYATGPDRIEGTATALTLDGFTALVNRHKNEHSAVFADADPRKPALLAVIDYSTTTHEPRFAKHRIAYHYPVAPEWQAWLAIEGKAMEQGAFASFIEDHLVEIVQADDDERELEGSFGSKFALPIDLLQLSRGLQLTVAAKVGSSRNLQSGESEIMFSEVHTNGAGEKLMVPGLFVLAVPLFVGAAPTRIIARLRYRVKEGIVAWIVQFWRWEQAVRTELVTDHLHVQEKTGLPLYEGRPEGSQALR